MAPLRFGAGIKGKVLEQFGRRHPVRLLAGRGRGLFLSSSLIAADIGKMVALLLRLHDDPQANADAAAAGFRLLAARHTGAIVERTLGWALAAS